MEELLIEGWEDDEYKAFKEKFKTKKTTDDCYTPPLVYDAVADWVAAEYGLDQARFVRPFFPGGDFERFDYPAGCTVVDNPPFSILARILRFYLREKIAFFLFAPALTLLSGPASECCAITVGVTVTYANGAQVPTSFVTDLEKGLRLRTAPALYTAVSKANAEANPSKSFPRYEYPPEILTAAMAQRWCKRGVDFRLSAEDCLHIDALDAQRVQGKAIFGGGYILSSVAAAERAAADRVAAERAAAKVWELSEREREIVEYIDRRRRRGSRSEK